VILHSRTPSPIRNWTIAAFGITQAVLFLLVLFPLLPGRLHVDVGEIASQTITAPKGFSYNSEVVRRKLQDEAAGSVKDVVAYDSSARVTQLSQLDQFINSIDRARQSPDVARSASSDPLRDAGILLPATVRTTLLALTPVEWSTVSDEARRVLSETLQDGFATDGLAVKTSGVTTRVSSALDQPQREAVAALVQPFVQPTEKVDTAATEAQRQRAIAAVPPQVRRFAANQDIVRQGEPMDASDVEALRAAGLLDAHLPPSDLLAVALVAAATSAVLALYLRIFQPAVTATYRRLLPLAIINALVVLLAKIYFPLVLPDVHRHYLAFALPVALASMLATSLFDAQFAVVLAAVMTFLTGFTAIYVPQLSGYIGLTALQLFQLLLTFLLGSLAGVYCLRGADRLGRYLGAAAGVTAAALVGVMAIWWLDSARQAADLVWALLACVIAGSLASLLTVGVLALVGPLFGIATRLQLMELGQLNAPLLRRLQEEAPGTFHHSILVGNLAERAADLVGADSLLVRVGCYYHDIGKMSGPGFFVENQLNGESPHTSLTPQDSAQIISEHVNFGEELARRYRLPAAVAAFIPEHHGTRMVSYFYRKAAQSEPGVDTGPFTYPGPRPQSKETAIVMLADSAEAATRAASERSRDDLDRIVDEVLSERISEGQLDESDLTLRDLRTIADSFKATLRAMYHPRIEYPAPAPLEQAHRQRAADASEVAP
jgi:putative nucleotidyltransferase with HDIG domain